MISDVLNIDPVQEEILCDWQYTESKESLPAFLNQIIIGNDDIFDLIQFAHNPDIQIIEKIHVSCMKNNDFDSLIRHVQISSLWNEGIAFGLVIKTVTKTQVKFKSHLLDRDLALKVFTATVRLQEVSRFCATS